MGLRDRRTEGVNVLEEGVFSARKRRRPHSFTCAPDSSVAASRAHTGQLALPPSASTRSKRSTEMSVLGSPPPSRDRT